MPHIILEHSNNIIEKSKIKDLFDAIHKILVQELPTNISNCKSRTVEHDIYLVGDAASQAFAHFTIKILKGRSKDTIDRAASIILSELRKYFAESLSQLNLKISLEIADLSDNYYKE